MTTATLNFTPSKPTNIRRAIRLYGTLALVATALVSLSVTAANSDYTYNVIGIQRVPAVVPGIRETPAPVHYYTPDRFSGVQPDARILHVYEDVGPNACGPNKFEIMNRDHRGPRCVGH